MKLIYLSINIKYKHFIENWYLFIRLFMNLRVYIFTSQIEIINFKKII